MSTFYPKGDITLAELELQTEFVYKLLVLEVV